MTLEKEHKVDLTVLIPVYNEEDNIDPLLEELIPVLEAMGKTYEVLFVDDGSNDKTFAKICEHQKPGAHIRVVRLKRNSGKTPALVAGWSRAYGRIITIMDGDLQNDPRDIPKLMAQIPPFDLAIGYRTNRRDTWFRRFQSRIANRIRDWVIRDGIKDSGCAFVAFRRKALEGQRFFLGLHRFLPALFQIEGYTVTQVPVNHRPRLHGKAKYNFRNRVVRAFDDMMAVRWIRTHKIHYEIESER